MNDLENAVATRLHSLADDLTPGIDVVGQVGDARARYHRRQRTRTGLALASVAIAAAAVGVPSAIGALSSSPDPGRDAARPVPTTSAARSSADGEPSAVPLRSLADDLRVALQARATPLSLEAPAAADSCPVRAPTVNSSFGATPAEHSSGAAAGDCLWRTPDGDLQVALGFMAGGTIDQIHTDVDTEHGLAGCLPTALPGSLTFTALALCDEDGGTGWHLRIMDTGGSGFWLLSVTVGDQRPEGPVATVAAVLDAVDADL